MNKTVTVNISGIVFHIEEDAYEKLGAYLQAIRSHFRNSDGSDEIMADIEARIAELFRERLSTYKEVLVMADVDHVISVMGRPEDFADGSEAADDKSGAAQQQQQESGDPKQKMYGGKHRRLFRDPDDKVVAGVCSGLGHYFDIDPVWIRLAWGVLFFAYGIGFLFYLLMMIVVPKAETTAEKLEMRGEPINVENIGRSIKDEFEQFGKKMGTAGKQFGERAKNWSEEQRDSWKRNRTGDRIADFFHAFFRILGRIFAVILIIVGIGFLLGMFTSVLGLTNFGPGEFGDVLSHLFSTATQHILAIVALFLFFGIPCIMLVYGGIRILFRIQGRHRMVNIVAFCLWLVGLCIGVGVFFSVSREFNHEGENSQKLQLPTARAHTLTVKVDIDSDMEINGGAHYRHWYSGGSFRREIRVLSIDGSRVKFGYPHLHILPAPSDSFEVIIYRQSQGPTKREAQQFAGDIMYKVSAKDSTITLGSFFEIGSNARWRDQEVNIEIRVPVGHQIFLDKTTADLLDDVRNVSDTWDGYMADRRWMMTMKGLACIDCGGLEVRPEQMAATIMATNPPPAPPVPKDTMQKENSK